MSVAHEELVKLQETLAKARMDFLFGSEGVTELDRLHYRLARSHTLTALAQLEAVVHMLSSAIAEEERERKP